MDPCELSFMRLTHCSTIAKQMCETTNPETYRQDILIQDLCDASYDFGVERDL